MFLWRFNKLVIVSQHQYVLSHPGQQILQQLSYKSEKKTLPTFSFSYRFICSAFNRNIWRPNSSGLKWNYSRWSEASRRVYLPAPSSSVLSRSAPSFSFCSLPATRGEKKTSRSRGELLKRALRQRGGRSLRHWTGERVATLVKRLKLELNTPSDQRMDENEDQA